MREVERDGTGARAGRSGEVHKYLSGGVVRRGAGRGVAGGAWGGGGERRRVYATQERDHRAGRFLICLAGLVVGK